MELSYRRQPREIPTDSATFDGSALKKYKGIRKYESFILT